jgi:hypothetical protein
MDTLKDTRTQIITTYAALFKEAARQCPTCKEIEVEAAFWEKVMALS